jgi:hypothetical protein
MRSIRANRPSNSASCSASARNRIRSPPSETSVKVKATIGSAMANRRTVSPIAWVSARSVRRNFSRAGVVQNRSRSSTMVPCSRTAGRCRPISPARASICQASSEPAARETSISRATAPIEGSASPRNP